MSFFSFFSKASFKSKDPEVRLKAVASLSDQAILTKLSMSDPSPRVRQ